MAVEYFIFNFKKVILEQDKIIKAAVLFSSIAQHNINMFNTNIQ